MSNAINILDQKEASADELETRIARGKRLKTLRGMADLSRKDMEEMEEHFSISASTIQSWEDAKAGGLTLKGAKKVVECIRQAGVRCTVEWLMYGIGMSPQLTDTQLHTNPNDFETSLYDQDNAIIKELLSFRQHNPNAIDLLVTDDGMMPYYRKGDYVAGSRCSKVEIDQLIGMPCIVVNSYNETYLRHLKKGSKQNRYTLICVNPEADVEKYVLYDQELIVAAPVLWHRRKNPFIRA